MEWIKCSDRLPESQIECVFYVNVFEWWAGIYTPSGWATPNLDKSNGVFQYHEHWGDDLYHEVENVTHWMPLPSPPK